MKGQIIWLTVGLIILNLCFLFSIQLLFRSAVVKRFTAYMHGSSFVKSKPGILWLIPVSLLLLVTLFNYSVVYSGLLYNPNAALGETLLVMDSPYDLKKTVINIQQAIDNSNNRFIRKQYVDNGFVTKKNQSKKEIAVYFCNFGLLDKTLKEDKRIGVFLPFQVTAIERQGRVQIVALNPKQLGKNLLGRSKINDTLNELHDAYVEILNEATI